MSRMHFLFFCKYTNKTSENYFTVIIDQTQSLKEFKTKTHNNLQLQHPFAYRPNEPGFSNDDAVIQEQREQLSNPMRIEPGTHSYEFNSKKTRKCFFRMT